jgi:hypothetical protein
MLNNEIKKNNKKSISSQSKLTLEVLKKLEYLYYMTRPGPSQVACKLRFLKLPQPNPTHITHCKCRGMHDVDNGFSS